MLIAEIKEDGRVGDLHLIFPRRGQYDIDFETHDQRISDKREKELQNFQDLFSFSLAKLENEFSLLRQRDPHEHMEISFTEISNSRLEVVQTGTMFADAPSASFALFPDEYPAQFAVEYALDD